MTNISYKAMIKHISILLIGFFICGTVSVIAGKELCWDLANYHYYNPFAFFNMRQKIDFWPPSFIHQYINPTLDFVSYFLINHFKPRITEFILGAIHGVNFWLIFSISQLYLPNKFSISLSLLIALIGIYGPTAFPGIGSFQNDNFISIFILSFVLLQLKGLKHYVDTDKLSLKWFIPSGILLGIGMGLKLTASLFFMGAVFAFMLSPLSISKRFKFIFMLTLGTTIGVLVSSGYWMYFLWHAHQNPLFPFFNGIFRSPHFDQINWQDKRFLPKDSWQTLFYPFYFAWDGRTADERFRDFRFPIVYILFTITSVIYCYKRIKSKFSFQEIFPKSLILYWLYAFFIGSYIIWQLFFSNSRYFVALEMLVPLVIYVLLKDLINNRYAFFSVIIILFYVIFFFMHPTKTIRAPWYDTTYFNIKLPSSIDNTQEATVLMAYSAFALNLNPRPQSYLIPFFPSHWHFIGIPFVQEKYFFEKHTHTQIQSLIHSFSHKIYLLSADENMQELYKIAKQFGLEPNGPCEKIFSDRQKITNQDTLLCPVR